MRNPNAKEKQLLPVTTTKCDWLFLDPILMTDVDVSPDLYSLCSFHCVFMIEVMIRDFHAEKNRKLLEK